MIVASRRREGLVLVRQVDHQEQCGLMAEAWGNADFARPEPFGPVARGGRLPRRGLARLGGGPAGGRRRAGGLHRDRPADPRGALPGGRSPRRAPATRARACW